MTLLVDPPPRNRAAGRPATDAGRRPGQLETATGQLDISRWILRRPIRPRRRGTAEPVRLAEPPIPGGRVEAAMGIIIRVLSHSRLARPLPAVILSALGLGGVAFVGLCATAPTPSVATPPVLLPLTSVARDLGAPHLPDLVADLIMYASIGLCCLGLAMMLWANSRGWSPNPRRVFWTAGGAVAVLVNITPVGSSDAASYAAYGRIAALGHNPYTFTPADAAGLKRQPVHDAGQPAVAGNALGLRAGGHLDAPDRGADRRGQSRG